MKHCIPLLTACGVMLLGLGLSGCSEQDLLKLLDNQTVTQDSTDEELALITPAIKTTKPSHSELWGG